ncbi:uncharacterized protein [Epargyreus clarus]|uniref:uncharacterized protein n=1 Tax=Epargyreus clarus TaxID=520877 RepID=UPI003C2E3E29
MTEPRNLEHARQLLREAGSDFASAKKFEEPLGFANPRDAMRYLNPSGRREGYETDRMAYRPVGIKNYPVAKNNPIEEELKQNRPTPIPPLEIRSPEERNNFYTNRSGKHEYFSRSGFDLLSGDTHYEGNWTTCKEFAKGAVFHPDDVIDIGWVPFYIWSNRQFTTAIVHTFSYLTKKVVKQYKETYGPYLSMKVDWEEPKLLMKELTDMLLIAGDRKGLFYGIQIIDLPDNVKNLDNFQIPVIVLRLKIVDPYLALMYCNEKYATIMAASGNEPGSAEEKMAEANQALKFKGIGKPADRDIKAEAIRAKYRQGRRLHNSTLYVS